MQKIKETVQRTKRNYQQKKDLQKDVDMSLMSIKDQNKYRAKMVKEESMFLFKKKLKDMKEDKQEKKFKHSVIKYFEDEWLKERIQHYKIEKSQRT